MVDMSDTPKGMIARLDDALRRRGSAVQLARVAAPDDRATIKGQARDFRLDELAGSLMQDDTKVVLSPTDLTAYGEPKRGDWIWINGRERSVENVDVIRVADTVVRYNLVVRG